MATPEGVEGAVGLEKSPAPSVHSRLLSDGDIERLGLLLMELSTRLVSTSLDTLDAEIQDGQRRICDVLRLDRSSLWQLRPEDPGVIEMTHIFQQPHLPAPPPRPEMKILFPWFAEQMRQQNVVAVAQLSDLPDAAAADREMLARYGAQSLAVIPFAVGNDFRGALCFASATEKLSWPEVTITWLKLIASVFAGATVRAKNDRRLQISERKLSASLVEVQALRDKLVEQNSQLRREVKQLAGHRPVIGGSQAFQAALDLADQVASTNSTVLLMGETGTGKGVIAARIHDLSPRHDHPMVSVNCAAIPALLLESELFGRERGAYTGALTRQIGRFELAHGSTIFLDEIGDLPVELQVKLLRVLEDRVVERLGSPRRVPVDVRIIAATNRDLRHAMREGKFREDLFYRLSAFPISIPPLRLRQDDIPRLVDAFVKEFSTMMGKRVEGVAPSSMDALLSYRWPGNVRELRNVIERAMILSKGPILTIVPPGELDGSDSAPEDSLDLVSVERAHIRRVLRMTGGRIRGPRGAAELLGLKPTTLESRMARLGVARADIPTAD
jgi:formate hydrogenlyase transcriptional activator